MCNFLLLDLDRDGIQLCSHYEVEHGEATGRMRVKDDLDVPETAGRRRGDRR